MTASEHSLQLLQIAAQAADSKGGEDLVALDVSAPLPFADVFLLVTGNSERNVVAIAREVEDRLAQSGAHSARREGRELGRWALLDFGDIVVHVFHEEDRAFYQLERLWKDCPALPIEIPAAEPATGSSGF